MLDPYETSPIVSASNPAVSTLPVLLPLTPPSARATLYSNDVCPRQAGARSGWFHYRENPLRAKTGGIDLPETGKAHPSVESQAAGGGATTLNEEKY